MIETPFLTMIHEGTTEVFVLPQKKSQKGPGTKQKGPFYNPAMELNRDFSVLVNQWFVTQLKKQVHIVDGLAASGIRGVRLAKEINGDFDVTVNDWDTQSFDLIMTNIKHNKLTNAFASQRNVNVLLSENHYHSIDIDPFGSPVSFVDSAFRSVYNNGIIACTATDTATLCGVYPAVCRRRYGAQPLHSVAMHEIGLRILLGFLCREAAKYDKGIEPLVSYATDHFFRVYVQVKTGKNHANNSVNQLSSIARNSRTFFTDTTKDNRETGPLWMGHLQKKPVLEELRTLLFTKQLNTKHSLWKLIMLLEEEAEGPLFFYTVHEIASRLKVGIPPMETIFQTLHAKGYTVVRTHFNPIGFKTNAPYDEIENLFQTLSKR